MKNAQRIALVIGGSGFIGTHLVRSLSQNEAYRKIIIFDVNTPRYQSDKTAFVQGDVRNYQDFSLLIDPIDEIYNLAAVHRTPGHPDREYYETNVPGATNTTRFAAEKDVPVIVFTSSIAVYGATEEGVNEKSETRPTSCYGISKWMAEEIHQDWHNAAPQTRRLIIVRPGVIFGAHENGNFTRLAKAMSKGYFLYPGRRDTIKSCGYVQDLIRSFAFFLAADDQKVTYNFCYDTRWTLEQICEQFQNVGELRAPVGTMPLGPIKIAAIGFELLNHLGIKNGINRARIKKLVFSTNILPDLLTEREFDYAYPLRDALEDWQNDPLTNGFT